MRAPISARFPPALGVRHWASLSPDEFPWPDVDEACVVSAETMMALLYCEVSRLRREVSELRREVERVDDVFFTVPGAEV